MNQQLITQTRRAFDRALQSLPVTQHDHIWPLYLEFVRGVGVWETAVRVYRRFLQYDPSQREEYVDYLTSIGHVDEAALQLTELVNDEHFVSSHGKSRHQLWMELCDLVSKHPDEIKSIKVRGWGVERGEEGEGSLRSGLLDVCCRWSR